MRRENKRVVRCPMTRWCHHSLALHKRCVKMVFRRCSLSFANERRNAVVAGHLVIFSRALPPPIVTVIASLSKYIYSPTKSKTYYHALRLARKPTREKEKQGISTSGSKVNQDYGNLWSLCRANCQCPPMPIAGYTNRRVVCTAIKHPGYTANCGPYLDYTAGLLCQLQKCRAKCQMGLIYYTTLAVTASGDNTL